jgi:integrase
MALKRTRTGGYQVWWYDADGKFRKRTYRGVTRDEAVRIERDLLARRDRGEPEMDRRLVPTVGAFARTWIEEHAPAWKPSTREQYEHAIRRWLDPTFGDVRLCDVTEGAVRRFVADLAARTLSPKRINFVVLVLRMIVRVAVRRHMLREDPLAGIRPLREPRSDVDPFAPEEVASFLAACPVHWRPYFTVAFWTGLRPGELAALKWGDVELSRGSLRVRAGRYRGHEGSPKTDSSVRDVDLLPPVVEALVAHRAAQAAVRLAAGQGVSDPGRNYVFTTPSGRCVDPNRLREQVWNRALARAGLRRRTMYQTRHSFASNALTAGEPPSWVAAMLGHTTPEMLFSVYARYIPNRTRRDGSALLARMVSSQPNEPPRTPDLLPSDGVTVPDPWKLAALRKAKCERGDLNPFGALLSI